nr:unnamed protein product [Digitaria exilis]
MNLNEHSRTSASPPSQKVTTSPCASRQKTVSPPVATSKPTSCSEMAAAVEEGGQAKQIDHAKEQVVATRKKKKQGWKCMPFIIVLLSTHIMLDDTGHWAPVGSFPL